nr:sensor domain-containing diguanylate cyclase [Novosphingobium hassiacum]
MIDEQGRIAALHRYEVLDTPPAEPFDKITALVRDVLQVPISAVSLVDRKRQWFKSVQGLSVTETARSVSFCSHTIMDKAVLIVPDALADARFADNALVTGAPHIRSYAGAPLQTPDGYNVGALCAIDTVAREFTSAQISILSSFASLVVDELELRRIAQTDHMTGALSRRGFVAQVDKQIVHHSRNGGSSVLVLLDIDHFKSVNDGYGHPAGDIVLKAMSEVCAGFLRGSDSFGRLGGEEFGILLTDVRHADGLMVAERIRCKIAEHAMPVGTGLHVTASFGVSALHSRTESASQWIAEADAALYDAKRSGRNRCVLARTHEGWAAAC